ncbi:MAG: hypothetical protein MJ025_00360 [Victivallaceae bacterium]|nr:hypothetical protein [Victivallaceae bacterium]
MKLGCSETRLDVPLFAELCGYGHYADRRNIGTLNDLFCRAFSFHDGRRRAIVVYTDALESDPVETRNFRAKFAEMYDADPSCIAFVATHTHSAPVPGYHCLAECFGYPCPEYIDNWRKAVEKVVADAVADEEELSGAVRGKVVPNPSIGVNRVEPETGITDPAIRWIAFRNTSGRVKVLLHNHGVHGIADNGERVKYVSSDWMGVANRLIVERGLADMPLFLQGPAGNINTRISCSGLHNGLDGDAAGMLGAEYVDCLEQGLAQGREVALDGISGAFETMEFPGVARSADELREDAVKLRAVGVNDRERDYWSVNARRLDEMALLLEKGERLLKSHDLQVVRIGDVSMFFFPGELFVEPGVRLLESSRSPFPVLSTLSNGVAGYFFNEECGRQNPDVVKKGRKLFGFYEVNGYMFEHRFRYPDDIAEFVIGRLLKLEEKTSCQN